MEFLQGFTGAAAASTVIIPLVIWIFKRTYDSKLSKDLESFRAQLNRDLEASKAELARFSVEHQLKFSYLQTTRAQVIAEGYSKLRSLFDAVRSYTSPFGPIHGNAREDLRVSVSQLLEDAEKYIFPRLIYLPENSAEKTKEFLSFLNQNSVNFRLTVDRSDGVVETKQWAAIWDEVKGRGSSLLDELAKDYRKILDVD